MIEAKVRRMKIRDPLRKPPRHKRCSESREFLLLIVLLFALTPSVHPASITTFLSGESASAREDNERKASQMLEDLLNDGTLTEGESNSAFLALIGTISDKTLESLSDSLSPSIAGLISPNGREGSSVSFLGSDSVFRSISSNSFLGRLIGMLLCIECVLIGIKSFLDGEGNAFQRAVSKLVTTSLTLTFLAFVPLIGRAVINIFASMGNAISSGYSSAASANAANSVRMFSYMPSDALDAFYFCKGILSVEKVKIGGYSLPTIIPHLTLNIGEFLISLPFLCIMVMIIFWYAELFIILLSSYIIIPVCVLSEFDAGGVRSILRALIKQGVKLAAGIFIANLSAYVVMESVKKIDGAFTSASNTVIFCAFISIVIFFLMLKGPNIMISAMDGETEKNSGSLLASAVGGSIAAIGSIIPALRKKRENAGLPSSPSMPDRPSAPSSPDIPSTSPRKAPSAASQTSGSSSASDSSFSGSSDARPAATGKLGGEAKAQKGVKYGEVSAYATPKRMEAARTELMNEGTQSITEEMVRRRAVRDAKIEKLVKMERNGFLTESGEMNLAAQRQLERLRKGEE